MLHARSCSTVCCLSIPGRQVTLLDSQRWRLQFRSCGWRQENRHPALSLAPLKQELCPGALVLEEAVFQPYSKAFWEDRWRAEGVGGLGLFLWLPRRHWGWPGQLWQESERQYIEEAGVAGSVTGALQCEGEACQPQYWGCAELRGDSSQAPMGLGQQRRTGTQATRAQSSSLLPCTQMCVHIRGLGV